MQISVLVSCFLIIPALSKNDRRKVNVALETSFLLKPKDVHTNLGVINKFKTVLDQITLLLQPHAEMYGIGFKSVDNDEDDKLYKVMRHFGNSVLNYTAEGINSLTGAVKNHVQNQQSNTKDDIVTAHDLKDVILDYMESYSNTDGKEIKKVISNVLQSDNNLIKAITRRLNSIYSPEDVNKFAEFVATIDKHVERKTDPTKTVNQWFDNSIFDSYNKLNKTARQKLLQDVKFITNIIADNGDANSRRTDHHDTGGSKKHKHSHILKVADHDDFDSGGGGVQETTSEENDIGPKKSELIVDNLEFVVQAVPKYT